ncbi:hypothetical protein GCM10010411_42800 [Actinomadura fulvescens]|uniref:DUF8129 domain-containing protein n=1 Tax=Actinomadura fulvescens TaxID=46160 RepID=A0ABN3PZG4_9ACTN
MKSPRRLKQQVQDTVGEQVRDLPLHAVRLAMFGVGRALLLSDRVTKDYKEITEGGGVKPVLGRLRDDVQHTAEFVVGRVVERVRGAEEPEPAPNRSRTAVAEPPARSRTTVGTGGSEIAIGKPKAAPAPKPQAKPATEAKPAAQAKPAGEAKPTEAAAKPKPAEAQPKPAETKAEAAAADPKPEFEPKPEAKPAAQAEVEKIAAELPVPNYDQATLPQLRARLRGLSVDQVKLLREYERKHAARADVLKMYENRIAKLNGTS